MQKLRCNESGLNIGWSERRNTMIHVEPNYHTYKITYLRKDGQPGVFLVREDSDLSALIRFQMMTNYPRESITTVEVKYGSRWVRIS